MDGNSKNEGGVPFDVTKSTLSAEAKEFVPRFAPAPPPQHQYQNQHGGGQYNYEGEQNYNNTPQDEPQYRFHGTALDRIKQAENTLIANPGSFDDIMKPITDALTTAISNEKTLVTVIEEIFTQCVREANFRYTGARLCNYLSRNLSLDFQGGDFRSQLLTRCHDEHVKRDELAADPSKREHLQGFMLYMAELLLNMTAPDGTRIPILSQAVKEIILSLLNHPTDSSLKAIVQVLKLSGQYLEPEVDAGQGEGARPLDDVFTRIDSILREETLNSSVRNMLGSVVTLRSKDWGRKDSGLNGAGVNNPYAANNPYAQHNPYAHGPDYVPAPGASYPGPQDAAGGAPGSAGGGGGYYSPDQYSPFSPSSDMSSFSSGGSESPRLGAPPPPGADPYWGTAASPQQQQQQQQQHASMRSNTYYLYGQGEPGNGYPPQLSGMMAGMHLGGQDDGFDDDMADAFENFLLETGQLDQNQ